MTLDNLVGTTLERIQSDPEAIHRLLLAAERNLAEKMMSCPMLFGRIICVLALIKSKSLRTHRVQCGG